MAGGESPFFGHPSARKKFEAKPGSCTGDEGALAHSVAVAAHRMPSRRRIPCPLDVDAIVMNKPIQELSSRGTPPVGAGDVVDGDGDLHVFSRVNDMWSFVPGIGGRVIPR